MSIEDQIIVDEQSAVDLDIVLSIGNPLRELEVDLGESSGVSESTEITIEPDYVTGEPVDFIAMLIDN